MPNICMLHGKMQTLQQWAKTSVNVVEDLHDHEESDTRVFLHAQHATREHKAVIIKSSDTDLAVIAVSLQTDLPCSLYVFTGTGNRTRIIDITKVSSALGTSVCSALIGIHRLSGCDSTSAFYGKGQRKTFSVACEKDEYLKAFKSLGTKFNLEQSTFALLCQYVCHLYDQPAAENINEARYKAFCMASGLARIMPSPYY